MKLIDTHSHIDMIENLDYETILANAKEAGVEEIIVPTSGENSYECIKNLAKNYKNVFGALGVHPECVNEWNENSREKLLKEANSEKIVAIGEIGLDYYWDKSNIELQKRVFVEQIIVANELKLPIIVHDREAHKDSFDLLVEYNKSSTVIFHCFSGSVEFMRECVKQGFYIGLGGVVTFKNAKKMKEVALECPLDKLLVETDAPYLAPVPYRGKQNEPAYVRLVAQEIANIRNTTIEAIANATSLNAEGIFKL